MREKSIAWSLNQCQTQEDGFQPSLYPVYHFEYLTPPPTKWTPVLNQVEAFLLLEFQLSKPIWRKLSIDRIGVCFLFVYDLNLLFGDRSMWDSFRTSWKGPSITGPKIPTSLVPMQSSFTLFANSCGKVPQQRHNQLWGVGAIGFPLDDICDAGPFIMF